MRIRNETHWNTEDLRKLFAAGFKAEGVKHKRYLVRVKYARQQRWCSGMAGLYSRWMHLRIPKSNVPLVDLARVFVHELGHCLGLQHKEMANCRSIDVPWAGGIQVRKAEVKPVAPKPKVDVKLVRFEKAQKMLAKHQAKLQREEKLVKKWRAKVKYYEKRFAVAAHK